MDEECEVMLPVTLKSQELTKKIMEMKRNILKVKKDFFPSRYMSKYQASKDVKSYLIWLLENYKVEVIEENDLTEDMQNLRKYYDNSDNEMYLNCLKEKIENFQFEFIYAGRTYKVVIGSRKTGDYFENYGGFERCFEQYVENLKAQDDYYVKGTKIPKYEAEEQEKEAKKKK